MFPAGLLFKYLIRKGRLTVIDAAGEKHVFTGGGEGPKVAIRLHDKALHWKLLLNPRLSLPEAYMFGTLTIEEGDLDACLELIGLNHAQMRAFPMSRLHAKLAYGLRFLLQNNTLTRARRNVAHHYDLSNDLYRLFLDQDMQYSCAYFKDENTPLEQAQIDKKNHLIAKLRLEPGMRVLDIGSGWGGLAIEMAKQKGVQVTGVTLSEQQYALAVERAREAGVADRVTFRLLDYRLLNETFDRIVSVGMFEHVGLPHYREFFDGVNRLLAEDGIAVIHTIGVHKPSRAIQPWTEKYIFPGTYLPALSEMLPALERSGFWVSDAESLRLHYAYTLREWKKRFRANRDAILKKYDETFFRMYDLYLAGCEQSFIYYGLLVFQLQLTKNIAAAPITREYMYVGENNCHPRA